MSIKFVKEAEEEYEATIEIIDSGDYNDQDDLHRLKAYAAGLKAVILQLEPESAIIKEEKHSD